MVAATANTAGSGGTYWRTDLSLHNPHGYDLPVVVTRCANLYGGGDLNWNRLIPGTIRCLLRGDQPVSLTSGELDLLQVLIERPNRVLDRDSLLDLLKGYERSPFDRSIDVQIARLRAKVEPDTKQPRYIRTVWGKGYMFTPGGDKAA